MTTRRSLSVAGRLLCLVTFPLFFLACPPPTDPCPEGEDCSDGGNLPDDFCNSRAEADSDSAHCLLIVNDPDGGKGGLYLSRLPDGGADEDWYLALMPPLNDRSLLHVNAGYHGVANTRVNFWVNVQTPGADGKLTSMVAASDVHTGSPKPVDLILPFVTRPEKLYLQVRDSRAPAQVNYDNTHPYSVLVQVIENPDSHEPNDTAAQATPIQMAPANGGDQGTASGYLATPDDVDQYSINVTGAGNRLIYVHITGPSPQPTPPPPYRLSYTLYDPSGTSVSEGHMTNEFLVIDLATSRPILATSTNGTWRLEVKGYKPDTSSTSVGGDLTLKYDVEVRVLPDTDVNEPNDSMAKATLVNLTSPGTQLLHGKHSTVSDEEWFKVQLPSSGGPWTLRYQMAVGTAAGRFTPTSTTPSRQIRVVSTVTDGATASDRLQSCLHKETACPRGKPINDLAKGLVDALCSSKDPPLCLQSWRSEQDLNFKNPLLKNFVGAVFVPATHGDYYVMLSANGGGVPTFDPTTAQQLYADDREWTITLTLANDDDNPSAVTSVAFGSPVTGYLSYGYGRLRNFEPTRGDGIRGDNGDYDSYTSDEDTYEFIFPNPAAGAQGLTQLELQTDKPIPGGLGFEATFCTGPSTGGDGLCQGSKQLGPLDYTAKGAPWYLPRNAASSLRDWWTTTDNASFTSVAITPDVCWCFTDAEVLSTHFFFKVLAYDRVSNDPIHYTIRQSLGPYPSFSSSCPGNAGVDAGTCGFSAQPH